MNHDGLKRSGFTLIELLVVVSIIALLIAILLPALARARLLSKVTVCLANEHGIAIGLVEFTSDNSNYLPYSVSDFPGPPPPGDPNTTMNWADWLGGYYGTPATHPPGPQYVAYDPTKFSGTVWTCPLSDEVPTPHFLTLERWSYQYSMNQYMTAMHQPDDSYNVGNAPGQSVIHRRIQMSDAGSPDTILFGDGRLDISGAGQFYFVQTINDGLSGPPGGGFTTGMSPWPVDFSTGKITLHNEVVNVSCADGHCESLKGPWGTTELYDRFRRADMKVK